MFLLILVVSRGGNGLSGIGGPTPDDMEQYDFGDLQVVDVKEGEGEIRVKPGDSVSVHYVGYYVGKDENRIVFDSSKSRNQPKSFVVGSAKSHLSFWQQGILGMREGSSRTITIPAESAYGERSQGPIPPNSTLFIEVELLRIE